MAATQAGVEEVKKDDSSHEQVVTPWEAHAAEGDKGIDYDKLISESIRVVLTVS